MSTAKRKLGFYCLEMKYVRNKNDETFFDEELFLNLLEYIACDIGNNARMLKNEGTNKSMGLDWYEPYEKNNNKFVKIVFKSCKYYHSPDYMSSDDGRERESDKRLNEGEKEITHLLCKNERDEAAVIIEERRSGVSIRNIEKYLNKFLKKYLDLNKDLPKIIIIHRKIAIENIDEVLKKMKRVCAAELFVHKKYLRAGGLDLLEKDDACMRNELIITCKSKNGESLFKKTAKNFINALTSKSEEVSRVRILGVDNDDTGIMIDSAFTKRVECTDVLLNKEKGVVDSSDLFIRMEEIFYEEE